MKIIIILSLSLFLYANNIGTWDEVNPIILESQHNKKHQLLSNGIWIIASDKENTKLVNEYFKKSEIPNSVNFIMDTTRIPAFLFDLFVLPKIQKYKHTVLLSHNKKYNATLPYKENFVTILFIKNKIVTRIEFIQNEKALKKLLKKF